MHGWLALIASGGPIGPGRWRAAVVCLAVTVWFGFDLVVVVRVGGVWAPMVLELVGICHGWWVMGLP